MLGIKHMSLNAPKRKWGRPQVLVLPEPIPDTPENILRACLKTPPKKDWDYLKPGLDAYADGTPPTSPTGLTSRSVRSWPPTRVDLGLPVVVARDAIHAGTRGGQAGGHG